MNDRQHSFDGGALVGGALLIGLGVLFLLDQISVASFGDLIGTYWPMIIVVIGIPKLSHLHSMWSGLWLISIGAWLQAVRLHWHGLTYFNSWPLLLIVLGAGLVLRTLFAPLERRGHAAEAHDEAPHGTQ